MSYQFMYYREQQKREEVEYQLYYSTALLEDVRRQLTELKSAYQQQSILLELERQQRGALAEQVRQQQAVIADLERQLARDKQQQLMQRVSAEVRSFQLANNIDEATDTTQSFFSREMSIVPSNLPAPAKYPYVDWSLDYSMARLEDMMDEPQSARNTLFYALLDFHCKRLQALDVDNSARSDDLIQRVNEELFKKLA